MAFISGCEIGDAPKLAGFGSGSGSGCDSLAVPSIAALGVAEEPAGSVDTTVEGIADGELESAATVAGGSGVFDATETVSDLGGTTADGLGLIAGRALLPEFIFAADRTGGATDSDAGFICGALGLIGTELITTGLTSFAGSADIFADRSSRTAVPGNSFRTTTPAFARFDAATIGESVTGGLASTALVLLVAFAKS
jgi:hypothetical protein